MTVAARISGERSASATASIFAGDGEMRALCRALDWAATPLGPVDEWSSSLRTTVRNLLASRHPMFLFAGPDLVQIYNDAYRPSLGSGRRHPQALGMKGAEFWTEIWDIIGPQIEQVRGGGEATWHENHLVPIERNGRIEDVYWTYSYGPAYDDGGDVGGVLVVCQETTHLVLDMHERERLLALAESARAEAEAANLSKSEFLAFMSHELRTPLNAIGGYAELIEMGLRGPVTEHQMEDLRRIQISQRHLLGLINEVLNYAKLETGTVHYDLEAVSVRQVLSITESLVAPQAQAKGLTLTVVECPPQLAVCADSEKLRQILVNLVSNAVKFTRLGGRIELSCSGKEGIARIRVSDNGIGIPADKVGKVFEPFVQVRADLSKPHEGTGLGLAISRKLAQGMGGDLTATSELGVGSVFTLTLPSA